MSLGSRRLIQKVYEQIRDAAIDWSEQRGEPFLEDAAFNGSADGKTISSFWVELIRKQTNKAVVFREAADRFIKHLESEGLIGGVLPLNIKITKSNNAYDIEGNDGVLEEGGALLRSLAQELVVGFKQAEESVYEDHGKRPEYSVYTKPSDDGYLIIMGPARNTSRKRLWDYTKEFFDDHLLKPKIRFFGPDKDGSFIISLSFGLNEALSPNELATKVA